MLRAKSVARFGFEARYQESKIAPYRNVKILVNLVKPSNLNNMAASFNFFLQPCNTLPNMTKQAGKSRREKGPFPIYVGLKKLCLPYESLKLTFERRKKTSGIGRSST